MESKRGRSVEGQTSGRREMAIEGCQNCEGDVKWWRKRGGCVCGEWEEGDFLPTDGVSPGIMKFLAPRRPRHIQKVERILGCIKGCKGDIGSPGCTLFDRTPGWNFGTE